MDDRDPIILRLLERIDDKVDRLADTVARLVSDGQRNADGHDRLEERVRELEALSQKNERTKAQLVGYLVGAGIGGGSLAAVLTKLLG